MTDGRHPEADERFAGLEAAATAAVESGHAQDVHPWFSTEGPTSESSVFLFADLSESAELRHFVAAVQEACRRAVGRQSFCFGPPNQAHATVFTETVAVGERLSEHHAARVAREYRPRVAELPGSTVAVHGPVVAPGAVILHCELRDPSVLTLRDIARHTAPASAKIPDIVHLTVGYWHAIDVAALARLRRALREFWERPPVVVPVSHLTVARTVNRLVVPPAVRLPLLGGGSSPGR